MEDKLRKEGKSSEEIARELNKLRRDLGKKYKDLTPEKFRERIFERNTKKYGDKYGPTVEYLRNRGYSWEEIIDSAKKPGGQDIF